MAVHNLTFGVELEFIAIHNTFGVGKLIYNSLLNHGIPATGWEPLDEDINADADVPSYSRWRVETDQLCLSAGEKAYLPTGWSCESVELSSRKFFFSSDSWREEIAKVLQVLGQIESSGCRFITNQSTGFHVHVGNDTQPVPLRTAKNVFQIATAFERCIDELHTQPRITVAKEDKYGQLCPVYYPLSLFHGEIFRELRAENERLGVKEEHSDTVLDRLARIEEASSYEGIGSHFRFMHPEINDGYGTHGHFSSYNFDNLFAEEDADRPEPTGTIEFRQHTGTLDLLEILAWVSLTCSVSTSDLLELLVRSIDPELSLQDFLFALECPRWLVDHYLHQGIIGILADVSLNDSGEKPVTDPLVEMLVAQNDDECEERCSEAAVKAAIKSKFVSGLYGLRPEVKEIKMPETLVTAPGLEWTFTTLERGGMNVQSDEVVSLTRERVLIHFAKLYREGVTDFSRGL
ncbi:hypothetical protein LTR37_001506 [Vermiconidia calcicola]|uniref:Uncharacterized protein n=1 Tax=Vermiconidia calcicola TaxID=1690605 RepID=A0ACC3NWD7_9PEZI|nr:hypothetical protein LTR37_001506 [Vermiconidia calcicola]